MPYLGLGAYLREGEEWYVEESKEPHKIVPGENTSNEWLEPVKDEEYSKL